ncbi:MAG: glycosyltransferase family 4 protein [Alloalcanivorax venustensis]|uniref:glycosyltransferase family 4 protein n=2 Tax=Pseudomonadota TaxID=1224 RepID=UPI000C0F3EEC|nr:MAG: glycosyltransferase family 1 protein [Thalassobium sp.]
MALGSGDKILVVAGVPRSLVNFRGPLLKSLISHGLSVHVAAPDLLSNQILSSQLMDWGVVPHDITLGRTGVNPITDVLTLISLYKLFRSLRIDAVLTYTAKPVIYGTLAAWLAGIPSRFALITGLGYAFTGKASGKRSALRFILRSLYRLALAHSKLVLFQNPDDEKLFRELAILSPSIESRVVNGSGVNLHHFNRAPFRKGKVKFLMIARLLGDKGVREYVKAAALVKKRHPDAIFILVGDIDTNPDSVKKHELEEWSNSGVIDYLGRLEDVRPVLAESSVYVLPSYREGTPRTVLEAMATGRAIITTDAPGCRETVIPGVNGFLVPVRSIAALADAMCNFISEPNLIDSMGRRSREIAEEKYDVDKVNAAMLNGLGVDGC